MLAPNDGVNNLFGQDPPTAFQDGAGANYPANLYDSTGRFLYASVKRKFQLAHSRPFDSTDAFSRKTIRAQESP